jgi:hypothetical protein
MSMRLHRPGRMGMGQKFFIWAAKCSFVCQRVPLCVKLTSELDLKSTLGDNKKQFTPCFFKFHCIAMRISPLVNHPSLQVIKLFLNLTKSCYQGNSNLYTNFITAFQAFFRSIGLGQLIRTNYFYSACVCIIVASRETCMRRDLTVDFHNPRLEIENLVKK